jgi:protein TonB
MGLRRSTWILALVISFAVHGAVVAAFTPDADDIAEAGSGAGSQFEGSIDAVLGTDVLVEDLVSEELKPALDTEIAPAIEPVTLAALAPVETMPTPVEPPADITPAVSAAVEAVPVAEIEPIEPTSTVAPTLAAEISAAPIESDLAAAPIETPTEITPTETLSASVPTEVKPVETPPEPVELRVAEATPLEAKPVEVEPVEAKPVEEIKPIEAKPVEAKPVEPEPEVTKPVEKAEPVEPKKPTKEKARVQKAEKAEKARKAEAPKRGNAEADSRRGAATADNKSSAADSGRGRSREAGAGAAANSNYKGKVQSAIRRHTRTPSKAARMGITGRALVSFTVQPSGSAQNIVLASSSGNALLDDAALAAVRKASPFPRMPEGMSQISLTAPIVFESRSR